MAIPQTFIQELLARADVVDIVGRHVQLKKGGANFMGLCPFHGEKSPSFSVSPSKQFYHCFGCGKNGNAISFLMEHAGMTFIEAVNDLAQQYGLQVPEEPGTAQDRAQARAQRQVQATLTTVLEQAADAYRRNLKESDRAIDYLKARGVSGEIARAYALGYAGPGWRNLASAFANYDDPLLVESGLVIFSEEEHQESKRYDRFRDRIMFPIRNIKGECIGFGGRVLGDEKPKYLNSPETPVFSKGRELYGLFEARPALREHGFALVTEGYMDVVALAQLGFPNAVATLGTACTTEHVQKLFRFTDSVVFSFDGDAAGRRAALKALDVALPFATDVRSVKFLFLPAEHDPDSFIREFGKEAFSRYVAEAVQLSRFLIDSAREGCDLATAEGRAHLASKVRAPWMQLPQGALKHQLLNQIAELVQLGSRELTTLWQPAGTGAHAASSRHYSNDSTLRNDYGLRALNAHQNAASRRSLDGRRLPASRADHAARILLGNMATLETLSSEDHALLSALPAPHGPLFVWLESQMHEHGAQPWAALREGLRGCACEALAVRLMTGDELAIETPAAQRGAELRDVLDRLLIDQLIAQETQALQASKADPQALLRYREYYARRRAIQSGLTKSS